MSNNYYIDKYDEPYYEKIWLSKDQWNELRGIALENHEVGKYDIWQVIIEKTRKI